MSAKELIAAIQMEDILLLLFLLAAMAWVMTTFLLRIIRSVMPYHHSPYPVAGGPVSSPETSGGGIGIPLLVLLFAILSFLFYTTRENFTPLPSNHPSPTTITHQRTTLPAAKPKVQKKAPPKFSIEDTFQKKKNPSMAGWINQSPAEAKSPAPPYEPPREKSSINTTFGIQLKALSNRAAAMAFQNTFRSSQGKHIIQDNDGLYKVIVGSFASKEAAQKYQRKKGWEDGFVRVFNFQP